jgi:NADH-quinone oxidoreductase subunit N
VLALDLFQLGADLPNSPVLKQAARADVFQAVVGAIVAVGLFLSILLSASYLKRHEVERGEYYALMLFSASGMQLLAMSDDLVMIFIALEVMSLSTYALCAWLRRTERSAEAAFKYFLLGAFSSAIYLYGAALAYGATGSTALSALAHGGARYHPELLAPAIALVIAGFSFKVAAVPFHMWAPDVYEGAPTPVTAFMAVGVKAAAFAAFFRTVAVGFQGASVTWVPVIALLAILTMIAGNLIALTQHNVKRMLAYSSIAHAGYVLVGLSSAEGVARAAGGEAVLFYLAAYTVTAVGAFGVAAAIEAKDGDGARAWDLSRFAGLSRRRPVLAAFMATFLISLAGIPPTAGFMGKLLIFRAAVESGQVPLAIVGVVTSAIGAYYYLRVVVYMYFRPAEPGAALEPHAPALDWALGIACVLVFALGIAPGAVAEIARRGTMWMF